MTNPLAAQLRAIADQLDTGIEVTAIPTLQKGRCLNLIPADDPEFSTIIDGGRFVRDRWVEGDIGAKAGALHAHYTEAITIYGYWGGGRPPHMSILLPPKAAGTPWVECLSSAGDVGWIPAGAAYRAGPAGTNYDRWVAAGCPSANSGGCYDNKGDPLPPNQWQQVYDRMRAQQG